MPSHELLGKVIILRWPAVFPEGDRWGGHRQNEFWGYKQITPLLLRLWLIYNLIAHNNGDKNNYTHHNSSKWVIIHT